MIRDEIARVEALEERERIGAGEVSLPESRLPPGRVPDRQQRDVENPPRGGEVALDQVSGIGDESRVAGKEARDLF